MRKYPGFTMADIKSPQRRLLKLKERCSHIDQQIAELQDKKGLMEHEMRQIEELI